eukprot:gene2367-4589_t
MSKVNSTVIPIINQLKDMYSIVLASGSPRRKELLSIMGLSEFSVRVSGFAENLDRTSFQLPSDYCLATAIRKGEHVAGDISISEGYRDNIIVISSDTIVEINGEILEKPLSPSHAFSMLSKLSGNIQLVHTGVAILMGVKSTDDNSNIKYNFKVAKTFIQTTKVKFIELSDSDINAYIESGEPFDKAGAYGIQGLGGQFVDYIEGCYFNVMGLPIGTLSRELASLHNNIMPMAP